MAAGPVKTETPLERLRLVPFALRHAATVASWVSSAEDAYMLAPRTPPPLTPEKICGWAGPRRQQFVLMQEGQTVPVGYGELNALRADRGSYWLGHLIVEPRWRGRGAGTRLTRLLLRRAFAVLGARRVTLVVFPGNHAAIACYRAAGMRRSGFETHHFPAYDKRERLLRMEATAGD